MLLATSISVHGIHGVLVLVAAILFLIAAIAAWVRDDPGHRLFWPALVALGLCLFALAFLVH